MRVEGSQKKRGQIPEKKENKEVFARKPKSVCAPKDSHPEI